MIAIYHAVFEFHLYHIFLYRKPNKNPIKSFYFSKRKFSKDYVLRVPIKIMLFLSTSLHNFFILVVQNILPFYTWRQNYIENILLMIVLFMFRINDRNSIYFPWHWGRFTFLSIRQTEENWMISWNYYT